MKTILIFFAIFAPCFTCSGAIEDPVANPYAAVDLHAGRLCVGSIYSNDKIALIFKQSWSDGDPVAALVKAAVTRPLTRQVPTLLLEPYVLIVEDVNGQVIAGFLLYVSAREAPFVAEPIHVTKSDDEYHFKRVPTALVRANANHWWSLSSERRQAIIQTRFVQLADFGGYFRHTLRDPKTKEWREAGRPTRSGR